MSCTVILFNKALYNGLYSHPLTLTCIHMLFATCVTTGLRLAGRLNVPSFDRSFILKNVIPIGFLFACSLGFSNLAAVRLSVAFVQMIKALMPMFTLAVGVVMGMEKATTTLACVVSIMSLGVMVASYGEIHFEIIGFAFQLASIVTESGRLIATQSLLQEHLPKGASPLVSISLFAPVSFLFLLPIAIYNEPTAIPKLLIPQVGLAVAMNTLTAFTLNISVVILVSQTSGLTLTLAGIVKDILLIVASILIFGSPITYIQVSRERGRGEGKAGTGGEGRPSPVPRRTSHTHTLVSSPPFPPPGLRLPPRPVRPELLPHLPVDQGQHRGRPPLHPGRDEQVHGRHGGGDGGALLPRALRGISGGGEAVNCGGGGDQGH
jgi:hypothetical protein